MISISRPPLSKDELWHLTRALFGVELPREAVCEGHTSPFEAFAEGYFGNPENWVLWYGSRGTGKSYMLAMLALLKAIVLDVDVVLLGGSMAQSNNVQEHVVDLLSKPGFPSELVASNIKTELRTTSGAWIRPIPASQKTVRGPHPHMTLLDEIDEMEHSIYSAAQGQALSKENRRGLVVPEMTVASSTWQNVEGTFQRVFDEAQEQGRRVRTWCYKEVLRPHGWMDPEFVERKRASVPAEMFRIEYELGEPDPGGRAIDAQRLEASMVASAPLRSSGPDEDRLVVWEDPVAGGTYAAGADWAKENDRTSLVVLRTDTSPWRTVAHRRMRRRPWPYMVECFQRLIGDYWASAAHDATGLGSVVNDMLEDRALKVVLTKETRLRVLNSFISSVEGGGHSFPAGSQLAKSLRACTANQVWGTGHIPDDFIAAAFANWAARRVPPPLRTSTVDKEVKVDYWGMEVSRVEHDDGVVVFSLP